MDKLKDQHGLVAMTRMASVFLIRFCTVETALYLDFFGDKKQDEEKTNTSDEKKKDKDGKKKKDKYLQLKNLGLRYILDNQDLIYSEINK